MFRNVARRMRSDGRWRDVAWVEKGIGGLVEMGFVEGEGPVGRWCCDQAMAAATAA